MSQKKPGTDIVLCLPGDAAWEIWKKTPKTDWQRIQTLEPGATLESCREADVVGFPVSSAFAVPIRAATADPELLPDLVDLQLEKLNLRPETPAGNLLHWRVVDQEEQQAVVLATVLDRGRADELPKKMPERFEISPWLYYLPDNALVIWREFGRLVFVVTRGDQPAYFHAMSTPSLTPAAVQEIEHLMMPLFIQGVVSSIESVVLWTDQSEEAAEEALQAAFDVPVVHQSRPKPSLPPEASGFEPVAVANARNRAARMRRIRNIAAAAAAVYCLLPAFLVGRYLIAERKAGRLASEVASLEAAYGHVQPTLDQVRLMDGAINPQKFLVERLWDVSQAFYTSETHPGVRVTQFVVENEVGENRSSQITVKGEAAGSNHRAAVTFSNSIKNHPELRQEYRWDYKNQPPKDGKVAFEVRGISNNDTAEAQ